MSAEQNERIDALMTEHQGNRKLVAQALGLDDQQLRSRIHNSPDLKFKWGTKRDVKQAMLSPAGTISRGSIPLTISQSEIETAVASQEEDDKFRKGLQGLGLDDRTFSYAAKLQKFHRHHFAGSLDLLNGGLTRAALTVMIKIEDLAERLKGPFEGETALEEEQMLWESFHRACENLLKMTATAQDGALIRARIEVLKKQTSEKGANRGKPGFTPQTAVQINVSDKKQVEVKQQL